MAPLKVSISWRSRAAHISKREKTLPLEAWLPILRTPGVRFVSLQYGDVAAELDHLQRTAGISVIADAAIDPLADLEAFVDQVAANGYLVDFRQQHHGSCGRRARKSRCWTLVSAAAQGGRRYWFSVAPRQSLVPVDAPVPPIARRRAGRDSLRSASAPRSRSGWGALRSRCASQKTASPR